MRHLPWHRPLMKICFRISSSFSSITGVSQGEANWPMSLQVFLKRPTIDGLVRGLRHWLLSLNTPTHRESPLPKMARQIQRGSALAGIPHFAFDGRFCSVMLSNVSRVVLVLRFNQGLRFKSIIFSHGAKVEKLPLKIFRRFVKYVILVNPIFHQATSV